jgi:hypothetical protein
LRINRLNSLALPLHPHNFTTQSRELKLVPEGGLNAQLVADVSSGCPHRCHSGLVGNSRHGDVDREGAISRVHRAIPGEPGFRPPQAALTRGLIGGLRMKTLTMLFTLAVMAVGIGGCNDNKSTKTTVKKEIKVDEHGNETVKSKTETETRTINDSNNSGTVREEKIIIKEKDTDDNLIKLGPLEVKK